MANEILPVLGDYIVNIGLDVSKDKIKNSIQEKQVKARLEEFVQRQAKYNFTCTKSEEIDFGAVTDYICKDLIADMRIRLRGTKEERAAAHITILSKVKAYAQANTKLGEKRAVEMVSKAVDILRSYYRQRINADLQFISGEIVDAVEDSVERISSVQTDRLVSEMSHQRETLSGELAELVRFSPEQAVAEGLRLIGAGDTSSIETFLTNYTNALTSKHTLFPHYGYEFKLINGQQRLHSVPLSHDASKLYPPKIKCVGTVRIGEKYVDELTPAVIDYANRHQLGITLNVTAAQKLLGVQPDPVQHEAEAVIGESFTIPPRPFKKAFPCSISLDQDVEFDYVLLRTQEILDDGTIVISNSEQVDFPFSFTMRTNLATQKIFFTISMRNPTNKDILKYVHFMKNVEQKRIISIKSLELQEEFARGRLDEFSYKTDFDSLDEEVLFWEMVVKVEAYFKTSLNVPTEIYEKQYANVVYLYRLINNEQVVSSWDALSLPVEVTEKLKNEIAKWDETPFSLAYVGSVDVPLWGEIFTVPIIRRFLALKPKDLSKIKRKAEILDVGDEIRLEFIPGEGAHSTWEDTIRNPEDEIISS